MGLLYLPLIAIRPPPLSIETLPSGEIHAILPKGKKESTVKQPKGSEYTSNVQVSTEKQIFRASFRSHGKQGGGCKMLGKCQGGAVLQVGHEQEMRRL